MPDAAGPVTRPATEAPVIAFRAEPSAPPPKAVAPSGSLSPLFTQADLPHRWSAVITSLANATGLSLESSALLALTHYATWCGGRSGCYTVDGAWVSAAFNQIVFFDDPAVQLRAEELLANEFDRMETTLRAEITQVWQDQALGDDFLKKIIHPSWVLTAKFKEKIQGWVTWLRNPTPAAMNTGARNAFRQDLAVFINDPVLLSAMWDDKRHWLAETLYRGAHGSHAFCTRGAELKGEADATAASQLQISLLAYMDSGRAVQWLSDGREFQRNLVSSCLVWSPELGPPGRLLEPERERNHTETCNLQWRTTRARLSSSGTCHVTKDAAPLIFAWQLECREFRAGLSADEAAFLQWMETLPYKLYVPLAVTATNASDSSRGFITLAIKLTRFAARNALALCRRANRGAGPLIKLSWINPKRWSKLTSEELAVLRQLLVSDRARPGAAAGLCQSHHHAPQTAPTAHVHAAS